MGVEPTAYTMRTCRSSQLSYSPEYVSPNIAPKCQVFKAYVVKFFLFQGFLLAILLKRSYIKRQFQNLSKLSKRPRFDLIKGAFRLLHFRLRIKLRRDKADSCSCHGIAFRRRRIKLPFTAHCDAVPAVFFDWVLQLPY